MKQSCWKFKLLLVAVFITCSSVSWGFIPERPAGAVLTPEQTQEQLAEQQANNGVAPVVGTVEMSTPQTSSPARSTEDKAANAIRMADPQERAAADLRVVEQERRNKKTSPIRSIGFAFIFVLVGAAAVFGFKFYADKVVPAAPKSKPVKW